MRPIRLDFKGLRSYRAATTIDFADLDLFAIIGDTGAGKSTVIEALSLALYGRKTWTGGSNLEELIADGENTMAIELVFRAEGNDWTVTRSRHRNSSAPINKLECRSTGEKVDGNRAVNERIEALLGLDHSQFVRAVVLPQGRFDELLQATRTDRNKILRSIFGLDDLRRVRDDATRRRDSWRPVLFEARARRDALPTDPTALLAAAKVNANAAANRHATLAAAIAAADLHHREVQRCTERRQLLERTASDLAPDAGLLAPLEELAVRAASLVAQREQLNAELAAAETERDRATTAQAALLRGFGDHQQARSAAAAVRSVIASLRDLDDDATQTDAEITRLEAEAPTDAEPPPIAAAVSAANTTLVAAQQAAEAAADALERAVAMWHALAEASEAAAEQRAALEAAQDEADRARTDAALAGAGVAAAERTLEAAKTAHLAAMRSNAAVAAAQGLHAGDPCPVCSQATPHDFVAPVAADLDTTQQQVAAAEDALAAARQSATATETTSAHRVESLVAVRKALEKTLVTIGETRAAVIGLSLDPEAPDDTVALAQLRSIATSRTIELDAARQAATKAEQARAAAAAERAAAIAVHASEMASANARLAQIDARRSAQRAALEQLPPAWEAPPAATPDELDGLAASIESMVVELDELGARVTVADGLVADARQRFADLRAEAVEQVNAPATDLVRQLNEQLAVAASVRPLLSDRSAVDPASTDATVPDATVPDATVPDATVPDATVADSLPEPIATPVLLDQLADAVPVARRLLSAIQPIAHAVGAELARLASRRDAEADRLSTLLATTGVADVASLHSQAGASEVEVARARADIETLDEQVTAAAGLDAMLDIGRPYLANLELLIQSLRDQHFVDHLVSAREVELLGEATRRLKAISDGRYGFVPDFGVVRIASGEVRSPDTLSGGERFQAALALALALVEIASRGAGKLDAVFVDEGFGSLDGAALDVALDTLGSVAGGGKLVALISHLHPVAEYVDTVFNVTKDDLFGSTITKLDAEAREALLDDDIRSGLTR